VFFVVQLGFVFANAILGFDPCRVSAATLHGMVSLIFPPRGKNAREIYSCGIAYYKLV